MRRIWTTIGTLIVVFSAIICKAQDPQNQKVEDIKTDCGKIKPEFSSLEEAKQVLDSSKFSFSQQFKTTRENGVMAANYYTCDNEKGFLWIKVSGKEYVYKDVPHFKWKRLIETNDIDQYYEEDIKGKFPLAVKNR